MPYSSVSKVENLPKISIVTPSYEQADFIERTINSVLSQSYPNLEYFIQDGGSSDGTINILEHYSGKVSGWDSQSDSGQSQAINRGFSHATGEIMAWLNSDDLLLPGALDYVADYFMQHPDIDVVYGHRVLIDDKDQQIGRWIVPSHDDAILSWHDFIPQETLFWRRSIWEKAGGHIDESFRFAMDWDLIARFRDAGAHFFRLPRFLGGFRIHPDQKTLASITDIGFKEMDRIRERSLGFIPSKSVIRRKAWPYLARHKFADWWWQVQYKIDCTF